MRKAGAVNASAKPDLDTVPAQTRMKCKPKYI